MGKLIFSSENKDEGLLQFFLPLGSKVLENYNSRIAIKVKINKYPGSPPKDLDDSVRIYLGENNGWEDLGEIHNIIKNILPEVVDQLSKVYLKSSMLVYFVFIRDPINFYRNFLPIVADKTQLETWLHISEYSVELKEKSRYSLCLKFDYENLKALLADEDLEFTPGSSLIIGLSIENSNISSCTKMDLLNKKNLEMVLNNIDTNCIWICGDDFDCIDIYGKSIDRKQFYKNISNNIDDLDIEISNHEQ